MVMTSQDIWRIYTHQQQYNFVKTRVVIFPVDDLQHRVLLSVFTLLGRCFSCVRQCLLYLCKPSESSETEFLREEIASSFPRTLKPGSQKVLKKMFVE